MAESFLRKKEKGEKGAQDLAFFFFDIDNK